jgi:dsDNA-specific endonuclease/ATPase MutS2
MEFESIPGVGEKTAEALAELDDAERALETGDVAAIARAPGVNQGRAARITRGAIRREHDDDGEFLTTGRAREVYREVLGLLQDRTVTDYAESRLETFFPSSARSRVEEVREFASEAMAREVEDGALEALAGIEPLSERSGVTVRDRCLATTDAERYREATEAIPELSVEVVEDARGLAELARGYSTVIAIDETFAGVDVEGDVRVEPDALDRPAEIVPERVLSFFAENRDRIRAAVDVHRRSDLDADCDLDALEDALERLAADGTPAGDDELERLERAVDDLDAAVGTSEAVANDRLRDSIRERDVTVEGSDLLSLVEQGAGVDSLLSRELADEYAAAVEAARENLIEALDLDSGEADIARRAFGGDPTFPVDHDEDAISRLREELQTARDRRATRLKTELAQDLADERETAERLVRAALELDVELAVARFAEEFDCTMPEIVDEAAADGGEAVAKQRSETGFAVEGGRSPLLDVPIDEVDPVDYEVGGVALLSGVNSGGKTSMLDLVAAVVILAQMGLPVPAEDARVALFEDLHYHAKTQGTLDAGAFESTVREFAGLAEGGDGSLVLVDELESITEPGASAKIIAGILEALHENGATAVFVSHLAGEIRETTDFEVTVDGIEAEGLVDGELQVNRSPVKDHLARSTPELIVEKLAREARSASDKSSGQGPRDGERDSTFYGELLEKFE